MYISLAAANTYFNEERLITAAWIAANNSERTKALKEATRRIDRLNFRGSKTSATQDNQFPRDGDTAVPQDIMRGCAEVAYALLDGVDPDREANNVSVTGEGFSSVRTNYDRSFVPDYVRAGIPTQTAWNYLSPYLIDPRDVDVGRIS